MREFLVLTLVLVGLIVLYAPTVHWLFERWTLSVWHHGHGLFIPFIVSAIIWQKLYAMRHLPPSSSAWGLAVVIPALLLHALDAGMRTHLLSAISLVLILPGVSLVFLGGQRTRALWFPLGFAAFMLPIPLALTESLHRQLRNITAVSVTFVLQLFGVPVALEDTTLYLTTATLHVADACSGFATLYAGLAIASLTAYICCEPWRRALVLIVAVPVAVAANIVRTLLLILLVGWYGTAVLDTSLHPLSGVLAYTLALTVFFWLGRLYAPPKRKTA